MPINSKQIEKVSDTVSYVVCALDAYKTWILKSDLDTLHAGLYGQLDKIIESSEMAISAVSKCYEEEEPSDGLGNGGNDR